MGEAAEFLRWTAAEAPGATGYWPAPAVANYALAGAPVIDFATAVTGLPLFDGSGWNPAACADCGASVAQMPRVETFGSAIGQVHGTDAVLGTGAIDALCEQIVAGADHDGDVLVLCGTTLIVWTTIAEPRQVPGLWTIPHTAAGKSQIGGASNAGACSSPGWIALWHRAIRLRPIHAGYRSGCLTFVANARRSMIPTAGRCSTAWTSPRTPRRFGGRPSKHLASSFAS
ncbi:hypothetical protein NIIDMKKI_62720 [Mycobacterium kansasii]|uniref:Uncharacterized protein n=1 Tax=Mycobacterium kansasii TaxID=1768 RepID=A0A7G1IJ55_MYCKA|nr:hypothetical protein NIIDMKKI_62720 [Mycobacterium kansasii]